MIESYLIESSRVRKSIAMLLRSGARNLIMATSAALSSIVPASASEYNEYVDGDLSGAIESPTPFRLEIGSNVLVASSSVSDFDLIKVSVPDNYSLDTIGIEFHEGPIRVFTAVQQGEIWTAGVGFDVDPSGLLGWVDFPFNPEQSHTGVDILAEMSLAPGALGFAPPLGSGEFTFLFQSPSSAVPFAISFNVSSDSLGLPGDFNGDTVVNGLDLARWRQAFGVNRNADANGDGQSDGNDFLIWQRDVGKNTVVANGFGVPEPSSASLVAGAVAALFARYASRRPRTSQPESERLES